MNRTVRPLLTAVALVAFVAGCGKSSENPAASANAAAQQATAAAEKAGESAAKAGEAAAKAGELAAVKAGEAAAKAGEAAAKAGEAAALAAGAAAAKAGEAAAQAGAAAAEAGAAAAAAAEPAAAGAAAAAGDAASALMDPSKATETAPETFDVVFETTKGAFTLHVTRAWAPKGADRLYNLVKAGFFADIAFFRAIEGFMVQFGIHGDPKVAAAWRSAEFSDDPVTQSNRRGTLSFATRGPNTRTTQMFINFRDNGNLDGMGFSPVGQVDDEGMKIVDSLYKGYGEGAPRGRGPDQMKVQMVGNTYLKAEFPQLDYIKSASISAK